MEIEINDNNEVVIDNIIIDNSIFEEEKINYEVVEREQKIDDLINWIGESESESDKFLMKEDLKHLISIGDKYIFSSISTNEFIIKSEDETEFNNLCKEILDLNKKI